MMKVVTDSYVYFDGDESKAVSAEWETQETPVGKKRKVNIAKKGIIYSVNLDKNTVLKQTLNPLPTLLVTPKHSQKV